MKTQFRNHFALWLLGSVVLCCFVVQHLDARNTSGISLSNSQVTCSFRESDGALLDISAPNGKNLCATSLQTPLWTLEIMPRGATKPVVLAADMARKFSHENFQKPERGLKLTYELDAATVQVEVKLADNSPELQWRIEVDLKDKDASLWSVTFPQIAVAGCDGSKGVNEMVVPYRRGQVRPFGKIAPRGDTELPYPGPSAKFQFMAAYGKNSRRGFYYAAEDSQGYTKTFLLRNRPEADAVIFAAQHFPENRGAGVQHFRMPYDIAAGPFEGDWWDAARIYRAWWVKQTWAGNGLLAERKDLPDWLLHAPLAVRASTTKAERTVANNETGIGAISDALGHAPFFGVWYGYPLAPVPSKNLDETGLGHVLPAKPGLVDTVHRLKQRGVHLEAYIQSMIYDAALPSSDGDAVQHAVTLDEHGKPVPYGSGDAAHLLAMCRAADWWQTRLVDLSKQAVGEFGFDGVYLDSFGKGAPECFATDHQHPVGGGNTCIAGQRNLASRVREAIRAINPQAIMSGEDPIEAFRDLLDVNLYSVNVMKDYVPVYRTVWGDYSLGHGRVLAPGKGNALIPELTVLFLEGTIPGRLYCDSPKPFLLEPSYVEDLAFFRMLDHYTQHGLAYLRTGEYLHPLTLTPAPPMVTFVDSAEKKKVQVPGVLHSVTRSHKDGSVAIVLVNIMEQAQTVWVPIDPALYGTHLQRMDEAGQLTAVADGDKPWQQKLEIQPREVVFWVLK